MRRVMMLAAVFAVGLGVVGCKSREAQIPGRWALGQVVLTFNEDKTFKQTIGGVAVDGTWKFENDKVLATPTTVNGMAVAEVLKQLDQYKDNPFVTQQLKQQGVTLAAAKEQLQKPGELTLSKDCKTLSMKNPKNGQTVTLTKSLAK